MQTVIVGKSLPTPISLNNLLWGSWSSNPLFVNELVRPLVQEGELRLGPDDYYRGMTVVQRWRSLACCAQVSSPTPLIRYCGPPASLPSPFSTEMHI